MDLFGIKSIIQRSVSTAVRDVANTAATAGLYNQKVFGWVQDNQPVFWEDNPLNYVINGYQNNPDVYTCIDKIISKLAQCPLLVYTVKNENLTKALKYKSLMMSDVAQAKLFNIQTKALQETPIDGLTKLINEPNSQQTTAEWIKQWGGFRLLNGNSYNYYNGINLASKKWDEMYVLPAPLTNIISGGDFKPVKGYNIFFSQKYYQNIPDFPAEQVGHLKSFNPNFTTYGSQLYGQAPLRAYIRTLVMDNDARMEQAKQIKNGGMMGMLSPEIGAPSIANPAIKDDLKQQIYEAKTSLDLVKRIFVSGAPAKWTQFGLSSVDLDILSLLKLNKQDIANCFNTPIQLLNDTTASTDNNMQWAVKHFIYNAVMPLGNEMADRFTRDTCKPYQKPGETVMCMFDYSCLPEMADDMQKLATALNTMYWISPNEKREYQGWGKSAEPMADKILVPKTLQLLEDIELTDTSFTQNGNNGTVQ